MAFNAKNLNYERKEPAFLRRLKGNITEGRDPDRQEYSIARPKKAKQEDEDDGPTYVVEESNDTLTKAEYEALVNGTTASDAAKSGSGEEKDPEKPECEDLAKSETDASKPKQQVASVGAASKKRKAIKIGEDADEKEEERETKKIPPKKPKKKAKAVKLSFGDEE